MLVDSFDKKNYAPTRSFENRVDFGQKNFKSILQRNSEDNNSNLTPQRNSTISRPLRQFNNLSDGFNSKPQSVNGGSQNINSTQNLNGRFQSINDKSQSNPNEQVNKVHIGTLSDDTPTVSELLYSTQYKKKCWEVLESDVNSSKRFKKIPAGTDIYLDKETSEILWEKDRRENNFKTIRNLTTSKQLTASNSESTTKSIIKDSDFFEKKFEPSFYKSKTTHYNPEITSYKSSPATLYQSHADTLLHQPKSGFDPTFDKSEKQNKPALNEAVREFMGKDYSKIDCYELVVNGLKNMGVKYGGKDGLGKHLIDKAIEEGRAQNHYLTGEGLVAATGHSVYNKTVLSVKNPDYQAQSAMNEMENVLKEGQILSFSTHSRGHTGVISRKNGVWTFINSGYMDNNIAGTNGKKQVGEEILSKELENWFNLAGKRKEGLQITLGDIDLSKLAEYREDNSKVSERV